MHIPLKGDFLQRLFSTFPDGWPGLGLLLLRFGAGIALICFGIIDVTGPPGDASLWSATCWQPREASYC